MRYIPFAILPLLAACQQQPSISSEAKAATKTAAGPIVIELYQSQGCSSCPPANRALNKVANREGIIALNFSVTYWDRLGWKDTFGDKAYTNRQYAYAKAFREHNVYTPQVVLNGRTAIVGNGPGELERTIRSMRPIGGGPAISAKAGKVTIGAGKGKADVWIIRYDPRIQNVAIRAGENNGRTLPHRNIVRQLVRLGSWNGSAKTFAGRAKTSSKYRSVVLVQRSGHREIIAARRF